jgi:hypothetical protein
VRLCRGILVDELQMVRYAEERQYIHYDVIDMLSSSLNATYHFSTRELMIYAKTLKRNKVVPLYPTKIDPAPLSNL